MPAKRYDRAYFDRWYRDPRHRVVRRGDVARSAAMVVGVAEWMLGRPVRSVLDVGCGEGRWQPALRRLRPRAGYLGIDPSAYAVGRFGARRNIRQGSFATLAEHADGGPYDVIVCCDVLHYLPAPELARGLAALASLLGGVAYLAAYTSADEIDGDLLGWYRRPPSFYRRQFARAGLVQCGPGCYVGPELAAEAASLELTAESRVNRR